MSHRDKNVMMWRFQTVGSKMVLLKLCVSIFAAMKMLHGKANRCFVLIAVSALGLY